MDSTNHNCNAYCTQTRSYLLGTRKMRSLYAFIAPMLRSESTWPLSELYKKINWHISSKLHVLWLIQSEIPIFLLMSMIWHSYMRTTGISLPSWQPTSHVGKAIGFAKIRYGDRVGAGLYESWILQMQGDFLIDSDDYQLLKKHSTSYTHFYHDLYTYAENTPMRIFTITFCDSFSSHKFKISLVNAR
jgi:hypothetical protein